MTPNDIPKTINGHAVKAFTIVTGDQRAFVVCHRDNDAHMPWVVAQWAPILGDTWAWANYFPCWEAADAYHRQRAKRANTQEA